MISNKVCIITEDNSLDRGGVQAWGYLIEKGLREKYHEELNLKVVEVSQKSFFVKELLFNDSFVLMNIRYLKAIFPLFWVVSWFKNVTVLIHGDDILYKSFIEKIYVYSLLKISRARFVSNSKYTASRLMQMWGIQSDIVNPFVLSANKVKVESKISGPKRIISIGRLVKRKNHINVIRALELLVGEGFDILYDIVGDGPEMKLLRDIAYDSTVAERVVFHGRISEEKKEILLSESDILILPSKMINSDATVEGYGMVFVEASGYGIPSIGGVSGGMPEAIIEGITGELTSGEVVDVSEKIKNVFSRNYDVELMKNHARSHLYNRQDEFYEEIIHG